MKSAPSTCRALTFQSLWEGITAWQCQQRCLELAFSGVHQLIEEVGCAWQQSLLALCCVSEEVSVGWRSPELRYFWYFRNQTHLCSSFSRSYSRLKQTFPLQSLLREPPGLGLLLDHHILSILQPSDAHLCLTPAIASREALSPWCFPAEALVTAAAHAGFRGA